jgi:hypothetical protein
MTLWPSTRETLLEQAIAYDLTLRPPLSMARHEGGDEGHPTRFRRPAARRAKAVGDGGVRALTTEKPVSPFRRFVYDRHGGKRKFQHTSMNSRLRHPSADILDRL